MKGEGTELLLLRVVQMSVLRDAPMSQPFLSPLLPPLEGATLTLSTAASLMTLTGAIDRRPNVAARQKARMSRNMTAFIHHLVSRVGGRGQSLCGLQLTVYQQMRRNLLLVLVVVVVVVGLSSEATALRATPRTRIPVQRAGRLLPRGSL